MKAIRVGIVGGGIAGLSAAYLLNKISVASPSLNIDVSIFESSSYLGSNLASRQNFMVCDTEHEVHSLARELGVNVVPERSVQDSSLDSSLMKVLVMEILWLKSKRIIERSCDWAIKSDALLDALDEISIVEFFVKKGKDADAVRADLANTIISAYTLEFDEVSALDVLRFLSQYIGAKTLYSVEGGVSTLTDALIDHLDEDKSTIFTNHRVIERKFVGGEWRLVFSDNTVKTFDFIIWTQMGGCQENKEKIYFGTKERHLSIQDDQEFPGLFFADEYLEQAAPSSMNTAIKNAYSVVHYNLIPMIYSNMPNKDADLTPTVDMAIFVSGNEAVMPN